MKITSRLVLPLSLLLVLVVQGCSNDKDETEIRQNIFMMASAVEKHDLDGITEYLADDYRDGRGLDKAAIQTILNDYFNANKNINLVISDLQVEFDEARETATTRLRVLTTGGEGALPDRGRLSSITSKWRKDAAGWRVTRADWRPVLLNLN